jgi:type IV secretion system protein VirD4
MPFLTERMAYLRSYNVRATLAIQSLQQLEATYGRDNSVLDLCGMRVLMATYDDRTAQRMSRLTGEATIQHTQTSHGQREGTWGQQHTQTTEVETARQLRTTGEVLRLAPGTCLVLAKEMEPLRGTTIRYFADKTWRARVLPPPTFQPENTIPREHPWQRHGGKMRVPDQHPNLHQVDDTSLRRER